MKKAWTDIKSFLTVSIIFLFIYCVVFQKPIPEALNKNLDIIVVFFLGTQAIKAKNE